MTHQILSWFTPTGLRPVPYFTVRISTKKINISVYTILLPARTPLHPTENTLLKPTTVTGAYTESTVKPITTLADPLSKSHHTQNPLCARTPLHLVQNPPHRSELPVQAIQTEPNTTQFLNSDDYNH